MLLLLMCLRFKSLYSCQLLLKMLLTCVQQSLQSADAHHPISLPVTRALESVQSISCNGAL